MFVGSEAGSFFLVLKFVVLSDVEVLLHFLETTIAVGPADVEKHALLCC